jgi:DNA replication factor GINS
VSQYLRCVPVTLTDAISVARESITAIHERRMGKIVKRASLAAAGMPANEDGLTAEEKDLFDNLVDQLENSREDILANLDAAPPAQPDVGDKEEDQADPTPSPEDSSESSSSDESDGQEPESVGDEAVDDGVPRQCVQVLTDVGEIFGVDEREYDLQEDDVVTLPEANAEALVGKDAAMILD